jgi:hypothetical protein
MFSVGMGERTVRDGASRFAAHTSAFCLHYPVVLMDNRNDRWWEIILAAEMGFIEEIDSTQWKKDAGMFGETFIWPPVPL